jgi:hypothetical protein
MDSPPSCCHRTPGLTAAAIDSRSVVLCDRFPPVRTVSIIGSNSVTLLDILSLGTVLFQRCIGQRDTMEGPILLATITKNEGFQWVKGPSEPVYSELSEGMLTT